jgi:hypothetical protein
MLERLVEVDPGTAYVIQHVLNNLEKEMAWAAIKVIAWWPLQWLHVLLFLLV